MLKKKVNGIEVILSAEEEATIRAEWADTEAKRLVDEPLKIQKKAQIVTLRQRLKALNDQPDMTAGEVKEALMKFIKLKVLQEEI